MNKIPSNETILKQVRLFLNLAMAIILLVVMASVIAAYFACQADSIVTQERVINLPQDQAKWYISVVGNRNSPRYKELLMWFDSDENLRNLKNQVHFKQVTSDTVIFQERYRTNIASLPTVRMQKANGVVVFEIAGASIPATAGELFKKIIDRPVLPWREGIEDKFRNQKPEQVFADPLPQPINENVPNVVDSRETSKKALVGLSLLGLLGGGIAGGVSSWRKKYSQQ